MLGKYGFNNPLLEKKISCLLSKKENINEDLQQEIFLLLKKDSRNCKGFVMLLKDQFVQRKSYQVIYQVVNMIVYLTNQNYWVIFNDFNSQQFLNAIYQLLNDSQIDSNIQLLLKKLFSFWSFYFQKDQELYNNFGIYYKKIMSNFGETPEPEKEWLQSLKEQNQFQKQQSFQSQLKNNIQNQIEVQELSPKAQKLYKDLQIVMQTIEQANINIDKGFVDENVFQKLESFRQKLIQIPQQLNNAGEHLLKEYVENVLKDIDLTLQRQDQSQQGKMVQEFKSSMSSLQELDSQDIQQQFSIKKQKTRSNQKLDDFEKDVFSEKKQENQNQNLFQMDLEELEKFSQVPKTIEDKIITNKDQLQSDFFNEHFNNDPFDQFDQPIKTPVTQIQQDLNSKQQQEIQEKEIMQQGLDPFDHLVKNQFFFDKLQEQNEQEQYQTSDDQILNENKSDKEPDNHQTQTSFISQEQSKSPLIEKSQQNNQQIREPDPFKDFNQIWNLNND